MTCDNSILEFVTGIKIEFIDNQPPAEVGEHQWQTFSVNTVRTEVQKLLDKGVIVICAHEDGEFVSPIFLRPKNDGTHRMTLNMKNLTSMYMQYHHFKMDTLEAAIKMMKPGFYMASVNLKDAYYTVAIHPDHQKYLKFVFDGVLYKYTYLPNGLSSAPFIYGA